MFGCPETERLDEIVKKVKTEAEAASSSCEMGRKQYFGTTLNTVTPCAACKLLRRRCAEECPFSPYFSPHEPHKFAAVHKVFGASNVSKMLMEVAEGQRADAANSLVYEANLRLRDPVYGCMGAISALQQQVQTLQAELNAVRTEIQKYKYREAAAAATLLLSSHAHPSLVPSSGEPPINNNNVANSSQQQGLSLPIPNPNPNLNPNPNPNLNPNPPQAKPLASGSLVLPSLSSSSANSSVYTTTPTPKSTLSHGSITSENVPYFV